MAGAAAASALRCKSEPHLLLERRVLRPQRVVLLLQLLLRRLGARARAGSVARRPPRVVRLAVSRERRRLRRRARVLRRAQLLVQGGRLLLVPGVLGGELLLGSFQPRGLEARVVLKQDDLA